MGLGHPVMGELVAYYKDTRTSPMFHREVEGLSVDLIAAYSGHPSHDAVGHSLNAVSFLLSGLDHQLMDIERQVAKVILRSQKPADYVHVPDPKMRAFFVAGRNVYPVFIAVNSFLYFGRTLLDQIMDLIGRTIRVSAPSSMNEAAKSKSFRKSLQRLDAEAVAVLIEREWSSWGLQLKNYRDLICHGDALSSPSIDLVEDLATGRITGARLYLPKDPEQRGHALRTGEYVNASTYFPEVRKQIGKFLVELLQLLNEKKRIREVA